MHANSGDGHSSSKSTQNIIMINICCTDGIITSIYRGINEAFPPKNGYRQLDQDGRIRAKAGDRIEVGPCTSQ